MKFGSYILHLYCDNFPDPWIDDGIHGVDEYYPAQYTGRTETECLKAAKEVGWKLGKKHVCPGCNKKGPGEVSSRMNGA